MLDKMQISLKERASHMLVFKMIPFIREVAAMLGKIQISCLMGRELSASSCTSKCFLFFSSSFEGFDGSDNFDGLGHFEGFDAATVSG